MDETSAAIIMGTMIPIFAVLGGILIAIFAIISRYRRSKLNHELKMKALEKGVDIPMEPATTKAKDKVYNVMLNIRNGIILLAVGFGVGLGLYYTAGIENASWSLTLILLGAGFLIYGLILKLTQKGQKE